MKKQTGSDRQGYVIKEQTKLAGAEIG